MKARKHHRVSNRMLLAIFVLTGFVLLLSPQKVTGKVHGLFTGVFKFPLRVGRQISLSARVSDTPGQNLRQKEIEYQNHIANLVAEIEEKTNQIEQLSLIRSREYALSGAGLIMADVVSSTTQGSKNELIINRGQRDGIEAGQFVLGWNSIIGTISQVWDRQAKIQLLTDRDSMMAVSFDGLNKQTLLDGQGNGKAVIQWSRKKAEVGQIIYAQKKAGFLDCPMITGQVIECKMNDQNPLLWDLTIVPACDIAMLPSVTVIVMNPTK